MTLRAPSPLSFHRAQGFTLVEMVVAIAILVVIATMAFMALDGAQRSAARTGNVMDDINALDKAWQLIGRDMRNVVPLNGSAPQQQIMFKAESLQSRGKDSHQVLFQFYRRGWINPLGRLRSDLQIVNYRLEHGKLIRDFLPERNVPLQEIEFDRVAYHQDLLSGVTDVQLRFLTQSKMKSTGTSVLTGDDYSRDWEPTWPSLGGSSDLMPVAVEMTIELEGGMRSVRLFEIPQL